jgi:sulfur-carrier protein
MSVQVRIPTVLRPAMGGHATLSADGATIGEILSTLSATYPSAAAQILDAEGNLHRFLNVYLNDDDVRYIGGLTAAVADGDEVTLLPAVAGGAA